MEKRWQDLQVGDYIWYYDHYKLHNQKVTHIETQTKTQELNYYYGEKFTRQIKELYIEAGKGTKMYINEYRFEYDECSWRGIPRFASYEAGKRFIERLINYRKRRIKEFKNKYERELKMLEKYKI